MIEAVK